MKSMEKVVSTIYITGGLILLVLVIMAMSSCGSSSKMYHIGTGKELSKSRCTGNYMYK